MTLYKGFSTYNRRKKFRVTDFELVKQDLFNHFNIRKGEKLMNPEFGTIIWNTLFEPLTEDVKSLIIEDIQRVAAYDPRVAIDNVLVTQFDRGIQIELELRYVTTNQLDTMRLTFDKNTQSLTTS